MDMDIFFQKQTEITASKITIYRKYITVYLPKLLITFNECFIADLFCGPGKNGDKKGSPIVLLEQIISILSSETLKKHTAPNLKITILFNDQNPDHISSLQEELKKIQYDKIKIDINTTSMSYEELLPTLLKRLQTLKKPKFFFLDPFTYSNVKTTDLQSLMQLYNSEVLLFNPISHSYRFATANFPKDHKTRIFIEEFTEEGMKNYASMDSFLTSIKKKLLSTIKLKNGEIPYVRYILLDGGGTKNSLFLLTGHKTGMLEMNKIAFKMSGDGKNIKSKNSDQLELFNDTKDYSFFAQFEKKITQIISTREIENLELIDFTIREGFLPKHTKSILTALYKNDRILIVDKFGNIIKNTNQWAIAEKPKTTTIIINQKNAENKD